jgi:competence protein ComEC
MLGIVASSQLSIQLAMIILLTGILMFVYLLLTGLNKKTKKWHFSVLGLVLLFIIFMTGATSNRLQSSLQKNRSTPSGDLLMVECKEEIKEKGDLRTFKVITHTWDGYHWNEKTWSYLYVYQQKSIKSGSVILTLNHLKKIRKKSNPSEFDFSRYAALNDIYHTLNIRNDSDYLLIRNPVKENDKNFSKIRSNLITIIRKHFPDKNEAGLAEAILLGYRKDLGQDLVQNYLDTGVIHVIAISGMHLGLIFGIIHLLITFTAGKKKSKWAALLISLPLLWCFAILTGASASVLRSALMFSFGITGSLIGKRNQSINALGGSLLILLLYDPDAWMDLGFQLSFAAVLSIMLFNKKITSYLYFRNPLLKQVWNLVSITLSAQILTTPLVIFHFHRFPTLFLFTNIIAVPLSSILLLLEIVICMLDPFPIFSMVIDPLIRLCMGAMNGYIRAMSRVTYGMIESLYFSFSSILCMSLMLLSLWQLLNTPSKNSWRMLVLVILIFCIIRFSEQIILYKTKQIRFLNIGGETAILHQHGKRANAYLLTKSIKVRSTVARITEIAQFLGIQSIAWKNFPDRTIVTSGKNGFFIFNDSSGMWKSRERQKAEQNLHLRFHSIGNEGPIAIRCSHLP